MLTRLRIRGFKNLADVEVHFGPFTCIAGGNAVGKSNLFDAISFLSSVAETSLLEAAMAVRDESTRANDVKSLFFTTREHTSRTLYFEADMVIHPSGEDDLGQPAEAGVTFLRYLVEIVQREETESHRAGLELLREELTYIKATEAKKNLAFGPSNKWLRSAVHGRRTSPFISTEDVNGVRTVRLHQEGRAGRTRDVKAASLPRTVLSTVNATESPTALLARRELQSWRLLQLEPSALRAPDTFTAPESLGAGGRHLPATLHRLSIASRRTRYPDTPSWISNRLAQLVSEILSVRVHRDEVRQLLTVVAEMKDGTVHSARSLSDGTLRFLALAVLEADPTATGVICLEEPENGIHPERIPAMLRLLSDLCVDQDEPVNDDNPLRQVIITTHSPLVVAQVPDDSLVFAEREVSGSNGRSPFDSVVFAPISGTWRAHARPNTPPVSRGEVLRFLQPIQAIEDALALFEGRRRLIDRSEFQPHLPYEGEPVR